MGLIADAVAFARRGENEKVIARMPSGWAVMGDVQFLPGYCVLVPDPVVPSLNDLDEARRAEYLLDMVRLGDAILRVTSAERINYEILGNSAPELHAHLFPRYATEPPELRSGPVWFYDWETAPEYDPEVHGELREALRQALVDAGSAISDAGSDATESVGGAS